MKRICTIALCFLLFAYPNKAEAQFGKLDTVPLFRYLQTNFDSTIVWNPYNTWGFQPAYRIVSKTQNQPLYFTYKNPYRKFNGWLLPKVLTRKFFDLSELFRSSRPDTNQFFLPHLIFMEDRNMVWDVFMKNDIWNLKDDKTDSAKCPQMAMDTDEHDFILITKSSIRLLNYYDIENCPQNTNRQKILKIMDVFTTVFGEWYPVIESQHAEPQTIP